MRDFLCILIILSSQWVLSQDTIPEISLTFENSNLKEVLDQIEERTEYQFFYLDEWLKEGSLSRNYVNTPLNIILEDIFDQTALNFYITAEYKIILTQNTVIHDSFPKDFLEEFQESTVDREKDLEQSAPVLYNLEKSSNKIKIVRIGKENRNNDDEHFTLSGVARNINTGEAIPELVVTVKAKNIGTVTNANGFYSLVVPKGVNIIQTRALGLENLTTRIVIYNSGQFNMDLHESLEVLDEVVVKANAAKNVEQAITGITQVEIAEIKNIPLVMGERDILKVATMMPGITNTGEGSAGYNVRGGKTDQNLILLDNSVIYNPSHFFGIFSALNPFTSDVANIYKGIIPAEYGGRLSSVFDIGTKNGNDEKLSGEASIGPVTGNLTLEIPVIKGKASLLVGGRATYSKWILRSIKEESLKNSKASFYDFIAKYHHKVNDNNGISVMGYYSKDTYNVTTDSLNGYSNGLVSVKWDHQFNKKNKLDLLMANSSYKFNIQFNENSPSDFELGYQIDETELKIKMKYLPGNGHSFDYGLSNKLYAVDPGRRDPLGPQSTIEEKIIPQERGWESAVFVSDDFRPNERLALNFGLRYSLFAALGESSQRVYEKNAPKNESTLLNTKEFKKNEIIKTYSGLEVRLGSRYFLSHDLSIKGSYNSTFQYIHALSNNTTASPTDTWKLSDTNIEPQRANQFSLGLYKNFEQNAYEMSVESYFKKSNKIIDYRVGAELLLNETIETEVLQGQGKSYGIEFLVKKNEGRLNGWLGYTYSRSLIKFDSEFPGESINNGAYFPSNFDKPHDISLVTNYKLTKRFSFSTNFVYQTGRPVTFPVGSYVYKDEEFVYYSDRNEFRIPDYYRLDVSFNIEGNHKIKKFAHSFWNISVYNLLGRNNPYSVFFVTENGQVKAYKSSIFSIPVPTITYNFKF